MTAGPRRWLLFVPPIVLVGLIALLLARAAGGSDRGVRERAITARWDSRADFDAVSRDVEAYGRDFAGEPEARWFAAEAWARMGRYEKALDAVRGAKGNLFPGADARRLSLLLLRSIGHLPGDPRSQTLFYPRALGALVDAGAPGAREELTGLIAAVSMPEMAPFFKELLRCRTPGLLALESALLSRPKDREFAIAAATLVTGPKDASHVPLLLEVLRSSWRFERRPTWQQVVRALGTSGDPAAVAALRAERERLVEAGLQADFMRLTFDVALALAGDGPAHDRVIRALSRKPGDPDPDGKETDWAGNMYVLGLQKRWMDGDATAEGGLRALFDLGSGPTTTLEVGVGCLLAEPLPQGSDDFLDAVSERFARDDDPLRQAVAHAYALRRGRPRALEVLEGDLETLLPRADFVSGKVRDESATHGALETLRGLARWAR